MKAMRHENIRSARDGGRRRAMTLMELLIVVFIMGILLAISVPAIKPMLETEKTRNAADSVASFLNQARIKAMETGLPCGVRFERYTGMEMEDNSNNIYYPYNGACLQLRQVAVPKPYGGCIENTRVNVSDVGVIGFSDVTEPSFWGSGRVVQENDLIQFDYQGSRFTLRFNDGNTPNDPSDDYWYIDWQEFDQYAASKTLTNVPFKVYRSPRPTLVAPLRFPQGIVVDLHVSGKENTKTSSLPPPSAPDYGFYDQNLDRIFNMSGTNSYIARDDFTPTNQSDTTFVTIMFLPNGEVDHVSYSYGTSTNNNPIFLCVGLWDRMGFWSEDGSGNFKVDNSYLPDDIQSATALCSWNYRDLNNFWVTVFPKNGRVIVQPMSAKDASPTGNRQSNVLKGSREYARDIQGIGGR